MFQNVQKSKKNMIQKMAKKTNKERHYKKDKERKRFT